MEQTTTGASPAAPDPGYAPAAPGEGPGGPITAVVFNDPGCPFGYSASPALRTLEWRYRDQIVWHLVTIGLSDPEHPSSVTPQQLIEGCLDLRDRYGMPFAVEPKSRPFTTGRSCQAITAARLLRPGSEWKVLRMLQLLNFNTPLLLDDDEHLRAALATIPGIDADAVVAALDSPEVQDAYRADWSRSRTAAGGASHLQGKTADSELGPRYTAPSVIFSREGRRLEVGGFQTIEAYDAAVANLDPTLNRIGPAEDPLDALRLYPAGLTTQEVAAVMAGNLEAPDRAGAELALAGLLIEDQVRRIPLGDDALWMAA